MRALAPDGLPGNVTRREFAPIYERENHPTVETASIAWSQASQIGRVRPTATSDGPIRGHRSLLRCIRGPDGAWSRVPARVNSSDASSSRIRCGATCLAPMPTSSEKLSRPKARACRSSASHQPTSSSRRIPASVPHAPRGRFRQGACLPRLHEAPAGRTQEQIDQDLRRLAADLGADPVTNQTPVLVAQPMLEYVVGDLKVTVLILFGATGILLLIACINVTNLLLSHGGPLQRVALREAIGAGRWRIVYQLLAESVVLVTIGGAWA